MTPPRIAVRPTGSWYAGIPAVGVVLYLLYGQLIPISEWITAQFPVARDSHTGEAIAFFAYDVPKVLLLLTSIVFVTGVLRSWFSPEKTRAILAGKREIAGYPLAALLGVFTPFCSCSSVPLFIGFVSAGIPLGVTFSFLIAGPMVGPVGLGLLYGLVGWKIATIYLVFGFTIATVAGFAMGKMGLERYLQDWVRELNAGPVGDLPEERVTFVDRLKIGVEQVREILGKVWIWVFVGIGIGALIHGYVPEAMMLQIMGGEAWWSVSRSRCRGCAHVYQRRRCHPHCRSTSGQGRGAGHDARLHDERDRAVAARAGHPQAGVDLPVDSHLHRRGQRGYPCHARFLFNILL